MKKLNYPDLPEDMRSYIEETCSELVYDSCEGYHSKEESIEHIEFKSRDGFIPFSHNHGGVIARQFTCVSYIVGSGMYPSDQDVVKEIDRQYEFGLECARETVWNRHAEEFIALGINSKDHPKLNYHDLYDMGQSSLADTLSEYEHEANSDDSSSIMYETQFLYHGLNEDGKHTASVSCAVNTEGPYHRRSISWAPDIFCEKANEVEIEFTNMDSLKKELTKALKNTSSKIF